jgi:tripartite-type tricarboxylate transporter receptor subunit TctC
MPIIPMMVPLIAIAAAFLAAAAPAAAQPWPGRTMTMVVPFAAGGASDAIARILAQGLQAELGQSVVVENVGGAGGMLGASRVARAAPDGYQMVLGNVGTHAQNQSLYKKPLYHAATDFAPVALVTYQSLVLVVRKDFPADDLQTFIAHAKANQASLRYGSAGVGGSNHLACVLLNAAIGIDVTHIPYRSGAQAMQDMLAGRIDYQCPSAPVALPQIKAATVRALAILSRNRSPGMPDLRSAHEQGLTDFDIPSWYALFLPSGVPAGIVQRLNGATVATLTTPLVQQRLKEMGSDLVAPGLMSPEHLGKVVAAEIEKWERVIKASGIQIE